MKALIFDMDGVLIDSMHYHVRSWQRAFADVNVSVPEKELYLLEGVSYEETIDIICRKYQKTLTAEQVKSLHDRKKHIMNEIFVPSAYDALEPVLHLTRNALVTGGHRELADKVIQQLFPDVFEVVITSDDCTRGKPDPEPYLQALKKLNVKASEALVIENAPCGITSAKRAGIRVWAVCTTLPAEELAEADKVFASHEELVVALTSLF